MPDTGSGLSSVEHIEPFFGTSHARQRNVLRKAGAVQNARLTRANRSHAATAESA